MKTQPPSKFPSVRSLKVLHLTVYSILLLTSPTTLLAEEARSTTLSRQQAPKLLYQEPPRVASAAAIGIQKQEVLLNLIIERDGTVSKATVIESAGEILDDAAVRAALHSRFSPALKEGSTVRSRITYSVRLAPPSKNRSEEASSDQPPQQQNALELPASAISKPEDFNASDPSTELVVITGSRVPEKRVDAMVATEVVERAEIEEQGMRTVEDVLFARPGIQLRRGFRGTELWIRGLSPRYSLVLIDSMRPAGRIGGAIDLGRYPTERIERVEIVRGPSSALYGSEAIGGVVNIITRQVEKELEASADMRMGTRGAYSGSSRVAGRPVPILGLEVSAGRMHTPDFVIDNAEQTPGNARTTDSLSAALNIGKTRKNRLNVRGDYTLIDIEGVEDGAGSAVFDRRQLQEQLQASAQHQFKNRRWFLQNSLSYSRFREQTLVDQRESDALDTYEDSREHIGQITSTTDYSWTKNQNTTGGAEVLLQKMRSPRLDENGQRVRYSVFAQHRINFQPSLQSKLTVVPGARLDVDSQFGTQLSPKLALRYQPAEPWVLRAGYGRGFRAPSFQQLLLRFENPSVGYIVDGNPDLSAESSHGIDVSASFHPGPKFNALFAVFRNDLKDMIAVVTSEQSSSGTIFSYDNLQTAYTQGIESQVTYSPFHFLSFSAGYTFTDTWDGEHDHHLEGQAPHLITSRLRLSHEASELVFTSRGSLSIGRPYYPADTQGTDEEVIANPLARYDIRLSKSFGSPFELFLGIDNLFNAGDEYDRLLPRQYYAGMRGSY